MRISRANVCVRLFGFVVSELELPRFLFFVGGRKIPLSGTMRLKRWDGGGWAAQLKKKRNYKLNMDKASGRIDMKRKDRWE